MDSNMKKVKIQDAIIYLFRHAPGLIEALEKRMNDFEKEGKVNSYYRVRSAKKAFESFCGRKDPHIMDITPEWLTSCEKFWRSNGKSSTTIVIYMKVLRREVNELLRTGRLAPEENPFGKGKYELPSPQSRKLALTLDQIRAIASYRGNATIERYRDLWLFSYLCNGINFRDMLFLRYRNIIGNEISYYRSKTYRSKSVPHEIRAAYTPLMQNIVSRWGNERLSQDTFLFKYARGDDNPFEVDALVRKVTSLCNREMRILAEILKIPVFTTYSARHSFATILNRKGVDLKYISDCLGHSSLRMTETYLAGFTEEDRARFSEMLL